MSKMTLRLLLFAALIPFHSAVAQWTTDSTSNTAVCQTSGDQMYPQIVSDGAGGAIIVWEDGRGSSPHIYAQRLDVSGNARWGTNGTIVCGADNALQPQIISDGSGGAIITWFDRRAGWPNADVYVQRLNPDGDTLWKANGVQLSKAANSWAYPRIAGDGDGGALVTWIGDTDSIFVQKINSSGEQQWTDGGVNAGPGGNEPKIISDNAGGAIVVYYRYDPDANSTTDIYSRRVTAGGVATGLSTGDTVCYAPDYQSHPDLAPDGNGGAFVTWIDSRNGSYNNVYAQRIIPGGGYLWARNGIPVSTMKAAYRAMVVNDGAGGAILTWINYDNSQVNAQRINGLGELQWPEDVRVEPAANGGYPKFLPDGSGGAVFIIEPDAGEGLRAQRLLSDGNVAFQSGRTVAWGPYMKTRPVFTYDGQGGTIVAWEDYRHYNADIYAQRIGLGLPTQGVGSGTAEHALPEKFRLDQNYPNPFNPATLIRYSIPVGAYNHTSLRVYDLLGREVAVLVNERQSPGTYEVRFDGSGLASGVYLCRLTAGSHTETMRMALVK